MLLVNRIVVKLYCWILFKQILSQQNILTKILLGKSLQCFGGSSSIRADVPSHKTRFIHDCGDVHVCVGLLLLCNQAPEQPQMKSLQCFLTVCSLRYYVHRFPTMKLYTAPSRRKGLHWLQGFDQSLVSIWSICLGLVVAMIQSSTGLLCGKVDDLGRRMLSFFPSRPPYII